jgi:hypothetical protein
MCGDASGLLLRRGFGYRAEQLGWCYGADSGPCISLTQAVAAAYLVLNASF